MQNRPSAEELLEAWNGWRTIAPPMKDLYVRQVELANEGAAELGFDDLGTMWRSGYDMAPDEFSAELDRLWGQVKPLYDALHCHVRARLTEYYGDEVIATGGMIPAHLLEVLPVFALVVHNSKLYLGASPHCLPSPSRKSTRR